jgi:acylphosphatase
LKAGPVLKDELLNMQDVAKHILFSGRVQGVGFRFTAHRIANNFGLTGFVRNLYDGRVEMFVQGSPDDIENCIEDIRDTYSGHIKDTHIEEMPLDTQHEGFSIRF